MDKWRNVHGRPIEHSELWKQFLSLRSKVGVRVDFGWVPGKSTPLLKKVDKAAKEAARAGTTVDRGYRPGKIGRAKTKGAATMFPAAGQVVIVRVYGSLARLMKTESSLRCTIPSLICTAENISPMRSQRSGSTCTSITRIACR
jgi:hypothetical protein